MRIRFFFITLAAFLIASCTSFKISDNESNGINQVLELYGGYCKYSVIWATNTKDGKQKKFELELSQSQSIDNNPSHLEVLAGGVAYTFFKSLKSEKQNYTHIKTTLIGKNQNKLEFEYSIQQLETVQRKMKIAENIAQLIIEKKFEEIKFLLNDSSYVEYNKNELIENLVKAEPEFGDGKEFIPLGFYFSGKGVNNLHIGGKIRRDKLDNMFSVDIDLDATEDKAVVINYKL